MFMKLQIIQINFVGAFEIISSTVSVCFFGYISIYIVSVFGIFSVSV